MTGKLLCFLFVFLFVVSTTATILTPSECTVATASVVVPGENSISFAITPQVPVLCFSLLSSDEVDDSVLLIDFEVINDEYVLDQNAKVIVYVNYNCTKTVCDSFSTTDADICLELSPYISSPNTLVPVSVSLINESTGDLFSPTEAVTVQFNIRWDVEACDEGNDNSLIWFIVLGIFIAIGLPVLMIIAVIVFLKMKKPTPPDQDYVIDNSVVSDSYY